MKNNIWQNIDTYLFFIYILLLPIVPYSQVFFSIAAIFIFIFIKIVKIIFTKCISFSTGIFDIPVIIIAATYLISTFFITPSKMDAVIYPGATTIIIVGIVLYFLANQIDLNGKKLLKYFLFAGAVLYYVMILLISTKVLPWFNPIDNYLLPTLYIIALIPIMINVFIIEKDFVYRFLIAVAGIISIFAMCVAIFVSDKPKLLPFEISTTIAKESLKQNLLLGVGSGNFVNTFNRFRPFEYNLLDIWSDKFYHGSSFLLTNLTETGVTGSMALLALIAIYINYALNTSLSRKKVGWGLIGSIDLLTVLIIFIELIIFQVSPILIFTLFLMLAIVSEPKKNSHILPSKIISFIIAAPLLTLTMLVGHKIYLYSNAEYLYNNGLKYLSENKAKESYDSIKQSININSKVDRYHKAMSSINFGIANALSKKTNLNEKDKEQITIFVQESINEAKAAVAINNKSSENWEFLGKTYHLLIPFTSGADQFAIESYKEAIALDPINPNLRIKLGEVYMLQKKYDDAIEAFNLAILAKDNHPNAHFNLANAYKENGETQKAKNELNKTLLLLKDSEKDYAVAKKALDEIDSPTSLIEKSLPIATDEAQLDIDNIQ